MATREQAAEAKHLRSLLGEHTPSALRAPLSAVILGTELAGTAGDIIEFARRALDNRRAELAKDYYEPR